MGACYLCRLPQNVAPLWPNPSHLLPFLAQPNPPTPDTKHQNAQVKSVKQVAEFVSQLRRVGKGLGVYEVDKKLGALAGAAA